ncbi:MAG: DMT family transporter [Halobacteria archaeon]|nr:DMT family transporter [Halobacteria archaeon]
MASVSLDVLAFSLLPALLWGFSPILSKRGMEAGGNALQASLIVVVVDTTVYWAILLVTHGPFNLFSQLSLGVIGIFLFAGVVGTAIGRLATFGGVHRVGASVNSAGISTRPLFATILALVWLGEPVNLQTATGIVVLVIGLVILALSRGGDIRGWGMRDLLFPLTAAGAFAVGNVVRRFGLTTTPATTLEAVTLNETAALVVLAGYAVFGSGKEISNAPRRSYLFFTGSGVITAVALFSLFEAFDRGPVAIVDPLAGTAPLFTTFFAFFLLRDIERVTRGVVAGAVLIVVGAGLITAF